MGALAIQQKLADANPAVNEFQDSLAHVHNAVGNVLNFTGKPAEAPRPTKRRRRLSGSWRTNTPSRPIWRTVWGDFSITWPGSNCTGSDLRRRASASARPSSGSRKALAANPGHPRYRQHRFNHYRNCAFRPSDSADAEGGRGRARAGEAPRLGPRDGGPRIAPWPQSFTGQSSPGMRPSGDR